MMQLLAIFRRKKWGAIFFLFAFAACTPYQFTALAPGLHWQNTRTDKAYPNKQNINILQVDVSKRQLTLVHVTDTLLPTSQLAGQAGAIAAINAGFFKINEGRGSATYLRVQGRTIDDLPTQNHPRLNGALILPDRGMPRIEYARPNAEYNQAPASETILVTGPVLLLDKVVQPLDSSSEFISRRHPRTCLCTKNNGTVLLVTVDGRHDEALGMSLFELTRLLQGLGCRQAINLDGGGSTTMWLRGKSANGVVNYPSDNGQFDHLGERPVANAVIVR